ncbi:hypothetical protein PM082_021047 [Marasmius tenuissimus]|nr:hypothetical protein PM082_021047 [Marasmius tenuissimus]
MTGPHRHPIGSAFGAHKCDLYPRPVFTNQDEDVPYIPQIDSLLDILHGTRPLPSEPSSENVQHDDRSEMRLRVRLLVLRTFSVLLITHAACATKRARPL